MIQQVENGTIESVLKCPKCGRTLGVKVGDHIDVIHGGRHLQIWGRVVEPCRCKTVNTNSSGPLDTTPATVVAYEQ